ncbi:hypothetical protein ROZALSC1DRAFT_28073 [Rozella allomycis CSF55]|uniref:non-specific serine/threonine protein kinase n=1 Tax=Rozella allomycis (strain CSF55) TaxID=988480 RepID=A0A4P9YLA7_ROZAC|nr:hypothetical protein ROZALSC1DRAFT_28073 [Rozella allomycis CSF55]
MYGETALRLMDSIDKKDIEEYAQIYSMIDEPDGLQGIVSKFKLRSNNSLSLLYELNGKWSMAASCYESLLTENQDDKDLNIKLVQCYNNMNSYDNLILKIEKLNETHPEWRDEFYSYHLEGLFKLGKWNELENSLKENNEISQIADNNSLVVDNSKFTINLIKNIVNNDSNSHKSAADSIFSMIVASESYERAYENKLIRNNYLNSEKLLSLQRAMISQMKDVNNNLLNGEFWLKSAKNARKDGLLEISHSALLKFRCFDDIKLMGEYELERAKWLWSCNQPLQARVTLESFMEEENYSSSKTISCSKIALKISRWMEEASMANSNDIIQSYQSAVKQANVSEKSHYFFGRYISSVYDHERINRSSSSAKAFQQTHNLLISSIKHLARSMIKGSNYIFEALPRFLTLWLDFAAEANQVISKGTESNAIKRQYDESLSLLTQNISSLSNKIPPYVFLIGMSQLVSRICHKHPETYSLIKKIIVVVLKNFTQHALWHIVSVCKSKVSVRAKRCEQVIHSVNDPQIERIVSNSLLLTNELLIVCNCPVGQERTILLKTINGGRLKRLCPLDIMIPLQSTLTIKPPTFHENGNPVSADFPTIKDFKDQIQIMPSLQKPRKITIVGSDGLSYIFLCKPKDDLRKDNRLMEFNSMINRLLKKNAQTRRRQLKIRTYSVTPLNEECGLIEWVNNTICYREILIDYYKEINVDMSHKALKELMQIKLPAAEKFKNHILPKYPPVFYKWFLDSFQDPSNWFNCRLNYIRTASVISIVGFILGLGDRHSENILYDQVTGDSVHVDFNCLFEKGLKFEIPERVPFRLTQNMVNAFGVTGYDGVFRSCAEHTLKLLRENKNGLMNVLETFLHDPLVEWSSKKDPVEGEVVNKEAIKSIKTIEAKLSGKMNQNAMLMSVEGQVDTLIVQATDPNNLGEMYIGWAPHL